MIQFATALVFSLCEAAVCAQWEPLAYIPWVNQWAFVSCWSKISGGFESLIINEKLNSIQEHSQELPPASSPHSCGVSIKLFVIIQKIILAKVGRNKGEKPEYAKTYNRLSQQQISPSSFFAE